MADVPELPDRDTETTAGGTVAEVWADIVKRTELFAESVRNYLREDVGVPSEPDEAKKLLSEALLVKVLEQIGVHGELPMPRGQFHQIVTERFELPPARTRPSEAELKRRLEELFQAAEDEEFEDGHESEFSRDLLRVVCHAGQDAVTFAGDLVRDCAVDEHVAAVALETFGEMWDRSSRNERRRVLEECLPSPSSTVRNGAVIGLASLSDARSIDALEKAFAVEDNNVLRDVIGRIVKRLREAPHGTASPEGE